MDHLTHLDQDGKLKMVDVGNKPATRRVAVAFASAFIGKQAMKMLQSKDLKKGDAIAASRVAAIYAAKKTSDLIPLTHPIKRD